MKTLFFSILLLLIAQNNESKQVLITINNIKEARGTIYLAVYDNSKDFRENAILNKSIKITAEGKKTIQLNLPKGEYAIGAFHDLNGNGKLDKNFVGIPKEGFGFSKKSIGTFGPPSYDQTKFMHDKAGTKVLIELKHL
ncbi:MAG: DUF2141 domain-containing protein [Fulvivirga sp.]|nr:DUF2141 domain-containing protein [Fulvivirga sp.]